MSEPRNFEGMPKKEGRGWRFYVLAIAGLLLAILIVQNALVIAGGLGALIGWSLPHVRRSRRVERERESKRD